MSCCWRPVAHRQIVNSTTRAPAPEGNGVIPLASYPEGGQPHSGEHRGETVYIVGWRTEHEALFPASDAKAAVAYRNSTDRELRLDMVPAHQLSNQVINDLYGTR